MKETRTTNILLLIIVIPLIFYLLKILSFIFIPLVLSMFITLLFLPLMRWLNKKRVPKFISVIVVIVIIAGLLKLGGELIQLSSKEIVSVDNAFLNKAQTKILSGITSMEGVFGIEREQGETVIKHYFKKDNFFKNFGPTLGFISNTITMTLMTVFFVILLLSGSINFEKLMNSTLFKLKYSSVKTFMKIEKDIIKFVKVKFLISLFTGIGFSLACLLFDVSFPIFWGLIAFILNFIQMIGSVFSVAALSLFAFIELDPSVSLLFFIITITAVQIIMGSVLEPIFMGKTFSINIITVLVMLMFWGYLWGVPGLILSIPLTVFIKIILEKFPKTQVIASIITGTETKISLPRRRRKLSKKKNTQF